MYRHVNKCVSIFKMQVYEWNGPHIRTKMTSGYLPIPSSVLTLVDYYCSLFKTWTEKSRDCNNHKRQPTLDKRGSEKYKNSICQISIQTHEKHILAVLSASEVITMLRRSEKHSIKEKGKIQHEMSCSKNHEVTQNMNYTRTTALTTAEFKAFLLSTHLLSNLDLNSA